MVFLVIDINQRTGIRFTMTAQPSTIHYTIVKKAGLMDPTLGIYAPAVTIDYNRHSITHSLIMSNLDDGVDIRHNEIMGLAAYIYRYCYVIVIWWSPFIPSRNLNKVLTYNHMALMFLRSRSHVKASVVLTRADHLFIHNHIRSLLNII